MSLIWQAARLGASLTAFAAGLMISGQYAAGQLPPGGRFELSGSVYLDEADSATRAHLERVSAYVNDEQWDEAVETLRQVMENRGGKLIRLTGSAYKQYVPLRDYCHAQIASLPAEAIRLYRGQVDTLAKDWYDAGLAARDTEILRKVVDQFFCSSSSDESLLALGEIALERGDYCAARDYWERIAPEFRAADGGPLWLASGAREERSAKTKALVYPDTDLNLADVQARLVLVSILEGSQPRAEKELAFFMQRHGNARGRLGGREGVDSKLLKSFLDESSQWPNQRVSDDWPTFAGSPERTHVVSDTIRPVAVAWTRGSKDQPLGPAVEADVSVAVNYGISPNRVAENAKELLSYHPVIVHKLLLYNTRDDVYALDLRTGEPAFEGSKAGLIYSSSPSAASYGSGTSRPNMLGVPRFTMTIYDNQLYARMGSPVTSRPAEAIPGESRSLVRLDLSASGKLIWKIDLQQDRDGDKWAFEGAPLSDGNCVYVAMRYSDVRPQSHVACFDARTRELRWRRLICSAETPARGQIEEATHNLLTLFGETLYLNTNLGAVAALSKADGQVKWITAYPRGRSSDLASTAEHFYRDLNPCIYHQGKLIVAPSDHESVFALDAGTGSLLWESERVTDVVHLLGVVGDQLWASGKALYRLNVNNGLARSPLPGCKDGFGRGVLAADCVYFPTKERIFVFSGDGQRQFPTIELTHAPLSQDGLLVLAGNLVVGDGMLVIAAANTMYGLSPDTPRKNPAKENVTQNQDGVSLPLTR